MGGREAALRPSRLHRGNARRTDRRRIKELEDSDEADELQSRVDELESEKDDLNGEIEKLKKENGDLNDKVEELEGEIDKLKNGLEGE